MDFEDRYIREEECFRLSGLSRTTRWRLERKDKFPRRRQLSDNAVGWLLSEVLAWRATRPVAVTVSQASVVPAIERQLAEAGDNAAAARGAPSEPRPT